MAKIGTPCKRAPRECWPPDPIDTCSVLLCPTNAEGYALQITGIYIPPSALATSEQLVSLTDPRCRAAAMEGGPLSHLLIGDFNPNCWSEGDSTQFQEWIMEQGMWDLTDPSLPTYVTGSSLDRILLCPGRDIPEEWLGPSLSHDVDDPKVQGNTGRPFYPAQVYPEPWIADHHPLQLHLKGVPLEEGTKPKVLKINDLTMEDWQAKNLQFLKYWDDNQLRVRNAVRLTNPTRLLDVIYQGLRKIFADQLRVSKKKKRRSSTEQPKGPSPFQLFCKRNLSHPDYPALIRAVQQADTPLATQIMDRMSRDGWRDYLANTHPSNVSAFFRFLAKEDGRQSRQKLFSCMAPLKDLQGVRHFTLSQKCKLMADFLQNKLAPKNEKSSQLGVDRESEGLRDGKLAKKKRVSKKLPPKLGLRRKGIPTTFDKFSLMEVHKAVHGMSKRKAAGPDGFVIEVYQNLPGILAPLRQLFNLIMDTGSLPLPMLKLHIVPLDKPLKDPEECSSKRPISLLNTLSKVLESMVLTRMINMTGMNLDGRQYAYRPHRGTETHLIELHDFVRTAQDRGEYIYLGAVDVDSAFDNVPHTALLQTAVGRNVDPHICRYLETWLRRRIFSVRLTSPKGRFVSNWRPIGKGVPQGGVLSPYLWLLHIDKLFQGMERRRKDRLGEEVSASAYFLDSLYADDILCAIAHKNPVILSRVAHVSADA